MVRRVSPDRPPATNAAQLSSAARGGPVTRWLASAPTVVFSAFAIAAAFTAYFSMYAFRKPWAVGAFEGDLGALDLKIALMLSQLLGYALSKFLGIRFISEVDRGRRAVALLCLIALAEGALLVFAMTPPPLRVVAMFFNGLPLGMVWGLVFSFLEGRRTSEILGAGLSASYIVASGAVKSIGKWLMDDLGVPEAWMPAATGALFIVPFVLAVTGLSLLPPPTVADEAERTHRDAMDGTHRRSFFGSFAPGLVALTVLYMFLTGYRDFRDNFARQLFDELGMTKSAVYTQTEMTAAFVVLGTLALIYLIRDNRRAFFAIHGVMLSGALLIMGATAAWQAGALDGFWWMALVGAGLYLAYVPYGCVLFDRLIAASHVVATSVFMIYVTDAMGYAGSTCIVLYKNFGTTDGHWLEFFVGLSYLTGAVSAIGFVVSFVYFRRRLSDTRTAAPDGEEA